MIGRYGSVMPSPNVAMKGRVCSLIPTALITSISDAVEPLMRGVDNLNSHLNHSLKIIAERAMINERTLLRVDVRCHEHFNTGLVLLQGKESILRGGTP